jgi:hypothetical protein
MKLELKHLAPYLPYSLHVSVLKKLDKGIQEPNIGQMVEITHKSNHGDWIRARFDGCYEVMYQNYQERFSNFHDYFISEDIIKPILRPISSLAEGELKEIVKHLFKDSHMIRPCYDDRHPITCNDGYISFYDDSTMQTYVAVKPSAGTGLPVLNMSNHFSDYDVFFKLHIDLFGLINSNLAIDINTITI